MSISMYIVGFIIFLIYIIVLFYMIIKGHEDQKEEILKDPEIPTSFKDKY